MEALSDQESIDLVVIMSFEVTPWRTAQKSIPHRER